MSFFSFLLFLFHFGPPFTPIAWVLVLDAAGVQCDVSSSFLIRVSGTSATTA